MSAEERTNIQNSIGRLVISALSFLIQISWLCFIGIKLKNYSLAINLCTSFIALILAIPLHIGKYTSVFTSIGFGMMITIFMNHIFPYLFSRALAVNDVLIESLVYVLFVLLVVDFIHEAKYMIKNKHINKIWKVDIKEKYIVNHDQVRYIH